MTEEEYSPEQKKKLAKHFVLVAPHGEVNQLTGDLKKIVKGNLLTDEWMSSTMDEYNKRRFVICEGDTCKVIICPQGEVGTNKYLNPDKKLICTVDPTAQKITSTDDGSQYIATGTTAKYRDAIDAKLQEYLKAFYEDSTTNPTSNSKGMGAVYASSQDEGKIAIVITFKNLNTSNFWTGGWQSEWNLNVSKPGSVLLEGRIRINAHYYEDGNVQLNSTYNESSKVSVVEEIDKTATNVVQTITTLENEFQTRLDKFYTQMHESTFKNMRRPLPKTQTKMDWRAVVHKMVEEVSN